MCMGLFEHRAPKSLLVDHRFLMEISKIPERMCSWNNPASLRSLLLQNIQSALAVKVHRIARGKMHGIAGALRSSNSKGTEKIQATGNMHAVKNAALVKLLLRRPAICFARFPW